MNYVCPVCGYDELTEPPYDDLDLRTSSSFEICPCCGTEFGYTDSNLSHDALRAQWIMVGMTWHFASHERPKGWEPTAQLRAAGFSPDPASYDPALFEGTFSSDASVAPHACASMTNLLETPTIPVVYYPNVREYRIANMRDGSQEFAMRFCPWDGTELPASLRNEWFERTKLLGLNLIWPDPNAPGLPAEMRTDAWWRDQQMGRDFRGVS